MGSPSSSRGSQRGRNGEVWSLTATAEVDITDAGALRILSGDSETAADSVDRGRATWRVTGELTDVGRSRQLAAQTHPDKEAEISESLGVAWRCAADPFAPLHSIDGIDWETGPVIVEHPPARAADSTGRTAYPFLEPAGFPQAVRRR